MPAKENNRGKSFRLWARGGIDVPFFAIVIVLLTAGLVMLFSATYAYAYHNEGNGLYYITRQVIFAVAGIVAMIVVSKIDYHILRIAAWPLYAVSAALLCLVQVLPTNMEYKRWIQIGTFSFQPSDIAKFAVVLLLAHMISLNLKKMRTFQYGVLACGLVFGAICVLVLLGKHLSATMLIASMSMVMMYIGGTDKKWFLFAIAGAIVLILAVYFIPGFMDHSAERIVAWLDKDYEPRDARWQTNNSLYAIGSGGLLGTGLGNSKQKYLYVSEPQNDFIFAIVCEELGFVGAALIVGLFIFLVWRGFQIAMKAPDKFGSLLVIGIIAQVGIQTVLNIAVVTDTIPNTGIALPFFSYGGTALMMLLFEMGVVLSVSRCSNLKKV